MEKKLVRKSQQPINRLAGTKGFTWWGQDQQLHIAHIVD